MPWPDLGHQSLNHIWLVSCVLAKLERVLPVIHRVWLVVWSFQLSVDVHEAITNAVGYLGPEGTVDGYLFEIRSQSVSMSVRIRKEPAMQNPISSWAHAWN